MYLSRIPLNPHRRGGRSLMGSPQTMHAAVLAAFPDSGESRGRVLWRLDRDQHNTWLYVVSRPLPDFSHIVEQAGWETPEGQSLIKSYEPLLDRLKNNQQWAFRVTVNPTVTHDKRRYGHVTVKQQQDWFLARTEKWGFTVPGDSEHRDLIIHDRRIDRFQRGDQTVTIAKATFDGLLAVKDVTALKTTLTAGVGPAKGYGCGLLTLASVR